MRLNAIRNTNSKSLIALILASSLVLELWLIWKLPIMYWDLPGDLDLYLGRTIELVISVGLIWFFAPDSLRFLKFKIIDFGWLYALLVFGALLLPSIVFMFLDHSPFSGFFGALPFSLFIGLDEEFFNRVFIYGLLERFGKEFALAVSALIFGLLHFSNFLFGGESFNYVIGHVISAVGFGYLMGVLMITTGSIWLPVMLHASVDTRWMAMTNDAYDAIVSGNTNWLMVIGQFTLMVLSSRVLLSLHSSEFKAPRTFESSLRFLGLIE